MLVPMRRRFRRLAIVTLVGSLAALAACSSLATSDAPAPGAGAGDAAVPAPDGEVDARGPTDAGAQCDGSCPPEDLLVDAAGAIQRIAVDELNVYFKTGASAG